MTDAERVVKALRRRASLYAATSPMEGASPHAKEWDALADFVKKADAVAFDPELVEPSPRSVALYKASLARLVEVFR